MLVALFAGFVERFVHPALWARFRDEIEGRFGGSPEAGELAFSSSVAELLLLKSGLVVVGSEGFKVSPCTNADSPTST